MARRLPDDEIGLNKPHANWDLASWRTWKGLKNGHSHSQALRTTPKRSKQLSKTPGLVPSRALESEVPSARHHSRALETYSSGQWMKKYPTTHAIHHCSLFLSSAEVSLHSTSVKDQLKISWVLKKMFIFKIISISKPYVILYYIYLVFSQRKGHEILSLSNPPPLASILQLSSKKKNPFHLKSLSKSSTKSIKARIHKGSEVASTLWSFCFPSNPPFQVLFKKHNKGRSHFTLGLKLSLAVFPLWGRSPVHPSPQYWECDGGVSV